MGKKFLSMLIAVVMATASSAVFAQTSLNYNVSATVPAVLRLGGWLLEIDSMGTSDPSDDVFLTTTPAGIDFGTLEEDADGWGIYRPQDGHYFMVNLVATTSARPYTIQHQMASTGNTDVDQAITITPIFSDALTMVIEYPNGTSESKTNADMGFSALPAGATLGGKHLAVGTWDTYVSSSDGETLIIGEVWGMFDGDVASQTLENDAAALVVGAASTAPVSTQVTYVVTLN